MSGAASGAVSGAVDGATDVSAAAWRSSRVAVGRLAVQLAGLGLVAYAADVFQVRSRRSIVFQGY